MRCDISVIDEWYCCFIRLMLSGDLGIRNDVDAYDNVIRDDIDVDNVIEMRWCWCWWWYWDEMMLMLIMTLRCDDVDVDDVIMMDVCSVCTWGCSDQVGYPWWGK